MTQRILRQNFDISGFEREPTVGDAEWKIGRKGWRLGEMVCLAVRLTGGLVKWCCSYLVRWRAKMRR